MFKRNVTLAGRLREVRITSQVRAWEVAEFLRLSVSTIYTLEAGKTYWTQKRIGAYIYACKKFHREIL